MAEQTTLRQTPLADRHRALGGRMVPFAGYEMPLNYAEGIVAEHKHCRAAAGIFDVSHMGQVEIRTSGGVSDAAEALERLVPADIVDLPPHRQRYALLTNDDGGIRDDLMVARLEDHLLLVVNAACKDDDVAYLIEALPDCQVEMRDDRALLALQGPAAGAVLADLAPASVAMRFMDVRELDLGGIPITATRSGYTGEDGFELSVETEHAGALFDRLLEDARVRPVGLGARDTLRLEAGLCLMGSDLDATTSPVEAALEWSIGKARRTGGARAGGFPGAARILAELADGAVRRRVGLEVEGRAPIRAGAAIELDGDRVGEITSGGFGPSLGQPIAMGYVASTHASPGTRLKAEQRGREHAVAVAALPFVKARQKRN
ncbi:MAG: glycine cleavage system aminomethyltransferase GcvT [Pseudomonadota bacterium]